MENTNTQPVYWFREGRRHGRAGNQNLDPASYGVVFADPNPPAVWVQAFEVGMAQGWHDVMFDNDSPSPLLVPSPPSIRDRLARALVHLADRISK